MNPPRISLASSLVLDFAVHFQGSRGGRVATVTVGPSMPMGDGGLPAERAGDDVKCGLVTGASLDLSVPGRISGTPPTAG